MKQNNEEEDFKMSPTKFKRVLGDLSVSMILVSFVLILLDHLVGSSVMLAGFILYILCAFLS